MIDKIKELLNGKKIAILGFGREGKSTYQFIRKYLENGDITIIDINDVSNDALVKDDDLVKFKYGENYLDNLEEYDLIIKSPGISLKDIDTSRLNITSQLELLLEVARDHVIGVTGTKGKTTTSMVIYNILIDNNVNAVFAGNMGVPIFDRLEEMMDAEYIVLEMSSHQLEFVKVSPHIGIILNLFEDHLDHAGSLEHYYECKKQIFKHQAKNDFMIYCADNQNLKAMVSQNEFAGIKVPVMLGNNDKGIYIKDDKIYYEDKLICNRDIPLNLKGEHNLENVMVALAVSCILDLDIAKTLESVKNFRPVRYRLELVGVVDEVEYYVDTLATIPQATEMAIKAIGNVNTLIFGGMDRGISYEGFAEFLKNSSIEHFICMPETGYKIAQELPENQVYLAETLEEACKIAKKVTKKKMACILSPAAASYNQFKNYAEKGDRFKELVLGENSLTNK